MSKKSVAEMTEAILSDDYEEGEILDDDTLYDDVSSLEEFSGSDTEHRANEKRALKVRRSSVEGVMREKHQRRKDHRCKENSICRKERSGKHCYTRIRKSKTISDIATEKVPVIELISAQSRDNHKKKPHGILSPVHDLPARFGGRRLPVPKDYPEKENRYSYRHARYHDSHRSPPPRYDKDKVCKKLRNTSIRAYDSRKRTRSRSPKSNSRYQPKQTSHSKGKTSLLKRLVGSGSIGVKTINEEPPIRKSMAQKDVVVSKQDEQKTGTVDSVEVIDITDDVDCVDLSAETTICVEPQENNLKDDSSVIYNEYDSKIIAEVARLSENTDEVRKNSTENGCTINNSNSFSEITEDIDELNLRLEALRTAMLRKHRERKKKGLTFKRKSGIEDDSFTAYALGYEDKEKSTVEAVQTETDEISDVNLECSLNDGIAVVPEPSPEPAANVNQSASSFVSFSHTNNKREDHLNEIISNKESLSANSMRKSFSAKFKTIRVRLDSKRLDCHQKRAYGRAVMERKLLKREYYAEKRRRRKELKLIQSESNIYISDNVNQVSDEEIELRELALKSVRDKSKSFDESTGVTVQSLDYSDGSVDKHVGMFDDLRVEVDDISSVKPIVSCDSESTPTNFSSNEAWDDIDEDILRAQLLSSLSCKIPKKYENTKQPRGLLSVEEKCCEIQPDKKLKLVRQKINKENLKKLVKAKSSDLAKRKTGILQIATEFEKFNESTLQLLQKQQGPVVPKFIISLEGDSSSEDEEVADCDKSDVVRSIDQFLKEARIENDLKQGLVSREVKSTSQVTNKNKSGSPKQASQNQKVVEKNKANSAGGRVTPQVLKHLPAWQQEEYYRLKKRIAEKERVLKAAKDRAAVSADNENRAVASSQTKQPANRAGQNCSLAQDNSNKDTSQVINSLSTEAARKDCNSGSNAAVVQERNVNNEKPKHPSCTAPTKAPPASKPGDSSHLLQGINQMSKMVENLEKEIGSFRSMYKLLIQKKKEYLMAKFNLTKKKKTLFEMREKLISQEKLIEARMEPTVNSAVQPLPKLDQLDPKKLVSRELELCKFKMREFSLRTKMIFDEINATSGPEVEITSRQMKPLSTVALVKAVKSNAPIKTKQDHPVWPPISDNNDKNLLSSPVASSGGLEKVPAVDHGDTKPKWTQGCPENQSKTWDPFVPICPYDLSGVCKDEECKFQHIKAT